MPFNPSAKTPAISHPHACVDFIALTPYARLDEPRPNPLAIKDTQSSAEKFPTPAPFRVVKMNTAASASLQPLSRQHCCGLPLRLQTGNAMLVIANLLGQVFER